MVEVEALDPFVTFVGDDCISAIKGDRVRVPSDRAKKLIDAGLAKSVEPEAAPRNKRETAAPENKQDKPKPQRQRRQSKASQPSAE